MHPILADRRRLRLHVLSWGLVGVLLGLLVHALVGVGWTEAMIFAVPLGVVAAPIALSAWYVCRATPISRASTVRVATTSLSAALVTAALWAAIGWIWWQALLQTKLVTVDVPLPPFAALLVVVGALTYLLSLAVHYLLQAFEESAEAAHRALELQISQRDAELRALRAQIDPHFLFNCLNSISGLVASQPDKAREMCQLLAEFLRDSLALGAAARIGLGREVALAEQYLRVEQVRFGRRLQVKAAITTDSVEIPVPPLILQPLVENAVRHGIATCLEGGVIEIDVHRTETLAVIAVTNPRDPDAARRGIGMGMDLVRRRLAASFGDAAALAVEPSGPAYRVVVTIPIGERAA